MLAQATARGELERAVTRLAWRAPTPATRDLIDHLIARVRLVTAEANVEAARIAGEASRIDQGCGSRLAVALITRSVPTIRSRATPDASPSVATARDEAVPRRTVSVRATLTD
jgi:hypothetical protein